MSDAANGEPTAADRQFMDDLTALGHRIFDHSTTVEAQVGSPLATSLMIYNRLWSNYRGYIILWKAGHLLEANIVLRAAIESAICLQANQVLREDFYPLLLGDLAASLKKMIKLWREMEAKALEQGYEKTLRSLPANTPENPVVLNWQELAAKAGAERLYEHHRLLSATSSHVTALSLMRGVIAEDNSAGLQDELLDIDYAMGPMKACMAQLIGSKMHSMVLDHAEFSLEIDGFEDRLNKLSERWAIN